MWPILKYVTLAHMGYLLTFSFAEHLRLPMIRYYMILLKIWLDTFLKIAINWAIIPPCLHKPMSSFHRRIPMIANGYEMLRVTYTNIDIKNPPAVRIMSRNVSKGCSTSWTNYFQLKDRGFPYVFKHFQTLISGIFKSSNLHPAGWYRYSNLTFWYEKKHGFNVS